MLSSFAVEVRTRPFSLGFDFPSRLPPSTDHSAASEPNISFVEARTDSSPHFSPSLPPTLRDTHLLTISRLLDPSLRRIHRPPPPRRPSLRHHPPSSNETGRPRGNRRTRQTRLRLGRSSRRTSFSYRFSLSSSSEWEGACCCWVGCGDGGWRGEGKE